MLIASSICPSVVCRNCNVGPVQHASKGFSPPGNFAAIASEVSREEWLRWDSSRHLQLRTHRVLVDNVRLHTDLANGVQISLTSLPECILQKIDLFYKLIVQHQILAFVHSDASSVTWRLRRVILRLAPFEALTQPASRSATTFQAHPVKFNDLLLTILNWLWKGPCLCIVDFSQARKLQCNCLLQILSMSPAMQQQSHTMLRRFVWYAWKDLSNAAFNQFSVT